MRRLTPSTLLRRLLASLAVAMTVGFSTGLICAHVTGCRRAMDQNDLCQTSPEKDYLAPVAVASFGDNRLLVLGSVGRRLVVLDRVTGEKVRTIPLPSPGSGLMVYGDTAYVTTAEPRGRVLAVDLESGMIQRL